MGLQPELTGSELILSRPELEYKGIKNYSQPQGWGCVGGLRDRGFYVPMTANGGAGSIKVDSTALPPEGEYVVVVTSEGPLGHVALAVNIGGKLYVRMEWGYGKGQGHGRRIPLKYYLGYIKSPVHLSASLDST